jgi:hypothetical protein
MTTFQACIVILLAGFIFGLLVLLAVTLVRLLPAQPRTQPSKPVAPEPEPEPEPVQEQEEEQEEEREVPMPVDPQNPPSWKVYTPRPGVEPRSCTCHPARPLSRGQKVLWWPVPHSNGAVNVFCEDGVKA